VLESKDLSKAGDLFSVEDSAIVEEFGEITGRIQVPIPFFLATFLELSSSVIRI
jgi:hypothetical protein